MDGADRKRTDAEQIAKAPPWHPPETDWEHLAELGEPEPRDWIIDQWLGMGFNTLIAGRGGIGKSLLALHLAVHIALGKDFIGRTPKPRIVLSWMGEDDEKELHRRVLPITQRLAIPINDLRGRYIQSPMVGEECCLMEPVGGQLVRTSALTALRNQIEEHRAEFVMLDNTSLLFGGNENDRSQVARFHTALRWAAQPTNAGILLIGHPAKNKGSEYSGSTAWENQARGRLYFSDVLNEENANSDDEGESDSDLRFLRKRKVNYSSKDLCTLHYTGASPGKYGTYEIQTPAAGLTGVAANIERKRAEKVALAAFGRLTTMNFQPSDNGNSPHYLPKLAVGHSLAEGFTQTDLARAMRRLMTDGVLRREQIGHYPNRSPKFGLVLAQSARTS